MTRDEWDKLQVMTKKRVVGPWDGFERKTLAGDVIACVVMVKDSWWIRGQLQRHAFDDGTFPCAYFYGQEYEERTKAHKDAREWCDQTLQRLGYDLVP